MVRQRRERTGQKKSGTGATIRNDDLQDSQDQRVTHRGVARVAELRERADAGTTEMAKTGEQKQQGQLHRRQNNHRESRKCRIKKM